MSMGSNTGDGRSAPGSANGKALGPRAPIGNVGAGQPQSTAGKAPPFQQVQTRPQPTYNPAGIAGSVPAGGRSPYPPMPVPPKPFKLGSGG